MRIAIHQPHYLPWLGLIDKMDRADLFVHLDHVQYLRRGWQNRNYVKTAQGPQLLTVPVVQASVDERIADKRINEEFGWRHGHRKTIEQSYRRTPHWRDYGERILATYRGPGDVLADLALTTTELVTEAFGITTPVVRSTKLDGIQGQKSEMIVSVCRALGATTYLSGDGARAYLDAEVFERSGIAIEWQDFRHPTYTQAYPKAGFAPRVAAFDLLLNHGPVDGLKLLRAERTRD